MRVPAVLLLAEPVEQHLAKHERFDLEARRRELQKAVNALRAMVPSAVFTLFAAGLSAGMLGSEEDVRRLEEHFATNSGAGSIIRDRPDMIRAAR